MSSDRESMEFDVVIVGAGPAGLAAAIRLAQLNEGASTALSIAVLEKGAAVGSHLLSGAVFEPRALNELIPDWRTKNAPLKTFVERDQFLYLSKSKATPLPKVPGLHNRGNYIASLGHLGAWLAEQAEQLGVSIFPGFCAKEVLYDGNHVIGVTTGDMGINQQGEHTDRYQAGINILAKQTLFAEGCRGHLSQQLIQRYQLRRNSDPQTYAIGVKELWQVPDEQFESGRVVHTIGWPLTSDTYGGGFMYHFDDNLVSVGLIVGLDYQNPTLDPFEELQQLKRHPAIKSVLQGGKCLSYGARALNEGGWQSIPQLHFPGGLLIGCSAGFVNVAKIKGNHTAMKSGMLAAEAVHKALSSDNSSGQTIDGYQTSMQASWLDEELYRARNLRPSFRHGRLKGLAYSALDQLVLRGNAPWTLHNHVDHLSLKPRNEVEAIVYPKPDNALTFSKSTQLYLSGTNHNHDQPSHLQLNDADIENSVNIAKYGAPETHYCPAGVYELVDDERGGKRLQINFQNCLHCKTCDIKDPTQNITWTAPEGGDGPNYQGM